MEHRIHQAAHPIRRRQGLQWTLSQEPWLHL
jgi:hypothetical protein